MICSNCKTEIEEGLIYCPICGKANQIVPDYNLLEDDILPSMLEKKNPKSDQSRQIPLPQGNGSNTSGGSGGKSGYDTETKPAKHGRRVIRLVIAGLLALLLILTLILLVMNMYSTLMKRASNKLLSGDYKKATELYEQALNRNESSVDAMIGAGKGYKGLGDVEKARQYFFDALSADNSSSAAYEELLKTYSESNDYDGMQQLESYALTDEEKTLYNKYYICTPEFSKPGGNYTDDINLILRSSSKMDIYYTLDGSEPDVNNGLKYNAKISFAEGTYTVKAVCVNSEGKKGPVREESYNIAYVEPERPIVSPMTGVFLNPTTITITTNAKKGKIYYTWGGKDPTEESQLYTEPIYIPKGDSILSVIVVDRHGLYSDVLRCSYSYLPESKEEETDEN
ncbi:MAG: chitobiase/beta-hexosaminidase C-terminal domain-containing protein [Lachnospiraceae bacterium]|nr:chitobiase/beta-hexosaminidase C-terminal domain-containing protein [Lachnospiraceae bacterium]